MKVRLACSSTGTSGETRAVAERAERDHARVARLRVVGVHPGAHARVHAVRADEEVAGLRRPVVEARHHAAGLDRQIAQALAVVDRDAVAIDRRAHQPVQVGARHVDPGPRAAGGREPDDLAAMVLEPEVARGLPRAFQLVGDAELGQHAHAIGRDLEAAAHVVSEGVRFQDHRLDAGAGEEHGDGGAGDAAPDDDGSLPGRVCFPCRAGWRRRFMSTTHES